MANLIPCGIEVKESSEGPKDGNEKCCQNPEKMGKTRPEISVDGDVKLHNAREVISAGANIVVSGSGVFGTSDPVDTMKEFAALT